MTAFRVSYTLSNDFKGETITRRIRQTFVSAKTAAAYYASVASFGPKLKAITVSDFKLAPSQKRLHRVHV